MNPSGQRFVFVLILNLKLKISKKVLINSLIKKFDKGDLEYEKICVHCNKEFDEETKKCSECGKRLKVGLTKEELEELKKQNDDMVAINTMMPM